ncbi:hypothetical protein [Motilibacter aurantiacus]|uniref:hypothetical protein n=1 Tax=Motilibacter aurantiacus TaxID=2714955 RepID=UPI00140974DA|nr:hypothetical protein [Motilibacter aurantiacus]NHC43719.1 hypothetical protein [Motilibacter aurantiacus]
MADLPTPPAARLPRARWLDVRFVVGVLLVLTSVVVGARVVAAADDTVAVWAVRHDVAASAAIGPADLEPRRVRIEGRLDRYVPTAVDPSGLVATRPVAEGELLPVAAVARGQARDYRAVPVEVTEASVVGLDQHAVVDVYVVDEGAGAAAARAAAEVPDEGSPEARDLPAVTEAAGAGGLAPVLRAVAVLGLGAEGGAFGGGAGSTVQLQVPTQDVGRLLRAAAAGPVQLVRVPTGSAGLEAGSSSRW